MRAMILAAGFGTRLWPLTIDRTKPAVPFLNKPLIAYSVEYLRNFGIREMVVNLHHQGESIRHALDSGSQFDANIQYSEETEILGTSGALDHARDLIDDGSTFVLMNGKVITDIDLNAAIETHRSRKAIATLVLKKNPAKEKFSKVILDSKGDIEKFGGYPENSPTEDPVPLMFTGIQILEPEIFSYIPRNQFSHSTTDVYPRAISEGKIVAAHISDGDWFELSTLARYLEISLQFLKKQDTDRIAGANSIIEDGADVKDSILWENVKVESGAKLNRVIAGDNVTVPANTVLENAVIVRAALATQVERGEIVGNNLIVPINGK